jgi:hypothetical protein
MRDLATITLYLNDNNRLPETIGSLGRVSVEMLSDMIRAKDSRYHIKTTAEALDLIKQAGLQPGKRNRDTLIKRLELEDAVLDSSTKPLISSQVTSDILEDITRRDKESRYSKEEMDAITKSLGGAIQYEDDAGGADKED